MAMPLYHFPFQKCLLSTSNTIIHRLLQFAVLAAFSIGASSLQAQFVADKPLLIEEEQTVVIAGVTRVFEGLEWDLQAILNAPIEEGASVRGQSINTLMFKSPVWMRVDFETGALDPTISWLLGFDNAFGGDLKLYVVANSELIQEVELASDLPFSDRPYHHAIAHFPLELPEHSAISIVARVDYAPFTIFKPTLTTERLLREEDSFRWPLIGSAFGILLAMMFYHLVMAGATLDKTYITYSLYLATNVLWIATITGLNFKFVWPDFPIFERHASVVFNYAPVILSIFFAVQFLELPSHSKRLARFYYALTIILILLTIMAASQSRIALSLLGYIVIFAFFSFIYAGIVALRNRVVYARYYLMAWSIYSLSIINWMLTSAGFGGIFPDYSYFIMIAAFDVQVLLLALALAHRIRSMRQSKIEADADNRAKSEFLARMSHEIRTPLSGVLGMAELLADRLSDKKDMYYLDVIRSSGKSLLTIINDILDYSKFSSGNLELEKISFNIQQLAVDSLDILRIKAAEKSIELIADVDLDMPHFLVGDPTRLKQVILNLASNAVKFTEQGEVVLRICPVRDCEGMVKIEVTDTGIGISKEAQEKLFVAFSQASKETTRKYGGTGLGLSICKQLAYFMGGEIGVESTEGKGSTFWVTANLPASEEFSLPEINLDYDLQNKRLLIVEDNYTFAELLNAQAAQWGMETCVAHNGQEALMILEEEYAQERRFDLVSLDLFMPVMDGMETSRRIQGDERFQEVPRLLLTSETNFPSKQALEIAGIRKIIEKPALPAELLQEYKEILSKYDVKNINRETPLIKDDITIPPLKVLVADDNQVNQLVINGLLMRFNQDVTLVDDGEKALQKIKDEGNKYDLVLMDCDMPIMDGLTATREIRAWEKGKYNNKQTIIGLSAHVIQSQIDACFQAGMDDYLTKPIDVSKLKTLLQRLGSDKLKASENHN